MNFPLVPLPAIPEEMSYIFSILSMFYMLEMVCFGIFALCFGIKTGSEVLLATLSFGFALLFAVIGNYIAILITAVLFISFVWYGFKSTFRFVLRH